MKGEVECETAMSVPKIDTPRPLPVGSVAGFAYLVPNPAEKG